MVRVVKENERMDCEGWWKRRGRVEIERWAAACCEWRVAVAETEQGGRIRDACVASRSNASWSPLDPSVVPQMPRYSAVTDATLFPTLVFIVDMLWKRANRRATAGSLTPHRRRKYAGRTHLRRVL